MNEGTILYNPQHENSSNNKLSAVATPPVQERIRIGPPTRRYTICCTRLHVVFLTRLISVFYIPVYLALIAFISIHGNATTVMFAVIITGWVSAFTIYGAFKGSKMCLIPFLFLQVIFIAYDTILLIMCIYGAVNSNSYVGEFFDPNISNPFVQNHTALLLISAGLLLLLFPLFWTIHIVWLNFIFISELDEILAIAREVQENLENADSTGRTNHYF